MSSVAPPVAVAATRFVNFDVLHVAPYRRLWLSGLCVGMARWIDLVVMGWLAFHLTHSPFLVALAAVARTAPMMALGPFAGVIADRAHRGRVLVATQSLGLVTALALGIIFAAGVGGYRPLVAFQPLIGALWAVEFPTRRTSLYALVGPSRVASAVSLETVSMQVAKVAGPLTAGIGLAHLGPAPCFGMIAIVYGFGLLVSLRLSPHIGGPARASGASVGATLAAGLRAAWTEPTVRAVLLITILMNTLVFTYQQMLPVFTREVLSVGPEWLGGLVAAEGFGALVGALAIASRGGFVPHRRLFAGAVLAYPLFLVAFSASRWVGLCLAIVLVTGVLESCFSAMQSTLVLLAAPERVRGGAMGILSACIGTQPFGMLWIGVLAASAGVPVAMAVNGLLAFLGMLPVAIPLARLRPAIGRRESPGT